MPTTEWLCAGYSSRSEPTQPPSSDQEPVTISPSDVEVTDSTGQQLTTRTPSVNQTIDRDSTVYTGAVSFDVASKGQYRIQVSQPSARRKRMFPRFV